MPFLMEPDEAAARIVKAIRLRRKVYDFPWPTALLVKLSRWAPDWLLARIYDVPGQRSAAPEGAVPARDGSG
jgi:hypothetical protein